MIYTIVPLGNPGKEYELTRHNAARIVLSHIEADVIHMEGCEVFVPKTFMNESGKAISEYMRYHEGRELLVIYDDKDIAIGKLRISHDRGDGGHNGVKSIIESLGTKDFTRIRIGIAPVTEDGEVMTPHGEAVGEYVLDNFSANELLTLRGLSTNVLGAIQTIINEGQVKAMEKYNGM
jgi:PTH1 family peptidyl-tRNA hydrolase